MDAEQTAIDVAVLSGNERARRVRDAVEASLSDIILLGTEKQVELAARAATELAEGRPTHTAELVVSLRDFIRSVLDLNAIPASVVIPKQGPTRPSSGSGGKSRAEGGKSDGREGGGGKAGGGGGMAGGGMGAGMAGGAAASASVGLSADDEHAHHI
jgi:hypothetical protein